MSIFLVGANGTLGLQIGVIARRKNISITCLIRNPTNDSDELTYRGARMFYGDMRNEKILLESMFASNLVIDASTSRIDDSLEAVEYDAKLLLLRITKELEMDRFVFFSLANGEKFDTIPLVQAKLFLESAIKKSGVTYTIFRLPGFYQGLVNEYARRIFDRKPIFVTDNVMPISYIDCMDAARLVIRSFSSKKFENRTVNLAGLRAWTPKEVIKVCRKRSGLNPRIEYIPIEEILTVRYFSGLFEETWDFSHKLALVDIIRRATPDLIIDPKEMLKLFEIDSSELRPFDYYIYYYYGKAFEMIFKRFGGTIDDDKEELEEWIRRGIPISETQDLED